MKHTNVLEFKPEEMIEESDMPNRYPAIFKDKAAIAKARTQGLIAHFYITRERILYTPNDVAEYLTRYRQPATRIGAEQCPENNPKGRHQEEPPIASASSNTRDIGLDQMSVEDPGSSSAGCKTETRNAASLMLKR
ncbi:hypothetical protein [Roseibium sp. TrichSKD4]|uniref:hypothetical protein n=1 Tax=Roseibium sp. TrichSKD4 TaxID=744980 RepID=UPI0011122B2E|nr:hypothetical protein [Roseibium sp. TrichSKD4]